jgi:uncharacterized protein (DUF983 family)
VIAGGGDGAGDRKNVNQWSMWTGRPIRCPVCAHEIRRANIRPGDFPCAHCGESLQIDTRYAFPAGCASLIVACYLSYLLGVSGYMFLLSTLLISLPLFLLAALLNRWFCLKLARSEPGVDFRITGPRLPPRKE